MRSKSSQRRSKILLFLSTIGFLTILVRALWLGLGLRQNQVSSWHREDIGDCAVVLTGGANRVREGFDLLSRGQVRKLILSGVYQDAKLREIFPGWMFYPHWSESDVVLERRSNTTYGNAQQSLPIVEALNCTDVILITSQIHLPRALSTFQAIFPQDRHIVGHSVKASRQESQWFELFTEVLKSWFYDLWVY